MARAQFWDRCPLVTPVDSEMGTTHPVRFYRQCLGIEDGTMQPRPSIQNGELFAIPRLDIPAGDACHAVIRLK